MPHHGVEFTVDGGIDQKKKSGSRSSSTQSARRAPAMTLSASSPRGVKELVGPPPKPGVNVDGGKRLVGALAAGVVPLEPPAMELHVNVYTCQL